MTTQDEAARSNLYPKVKPGTYRVGSPDAPHDQDMTAPYRIGGIKSYDAIWFPIDYGDQSHYIHVGNISHGCVTVYSMEDWVKVYAKLIENRMDAEGKYCAKLIVELGSSGSSSR